MKERAKLEEMYYRGNCPWMVWDPERSGAGGRPAELAPVIQPDIPVAAAVMLPLHLTAPAAAAVRPRVGAHPDDIEIGAGGLLLSLAGVGHGCATW